MLIIFDVTHKGSDDHLLLLSFRSSNILELVAAAVDDVADLHQSVPEQLQPMLKGAWLVRLLGRPLYRS